MLIPDFKGDPEALEIVMKAQPEVLNHNTETVVRLQREIRTAASYGRSLALLWRGRQMAAGGAVKSGLIVGMGETKEEVLGALADLRVGPTGAVVLSRQGGASGGGLGLSRRGGGSRPASAPKAAHRAWRRRGSADLAIPVNASGRVCSVSTMASPTPSCPEHRVRTTAGSRPRVAAR